MWGHLQKVSTFVSAGFVQSKIGDPPYSKGSTWISMVPFFVETHDFRVLWWRRHPEPSAKNKCLRFQNSHQWYTMIHHAKKKQHPSWQKNINVGSLKDSVLFKSSHFFTPQMPRRCLTTGDHPKSNLSAPSPATRTKDQNICMTRQGACPKPPPKNRETSIILDHPSNANHPPPRKYDLIRGLLRNHCGL